MNNTKDSEILAELRRITKLLAWTATKDQIQRERIKNLSNIGFQPKEIAELLDTTANTVRVALAEIRKKSKKGKAKAQRPSQ